MFIFGEKYGGVFSAVHKNDFHKNITYLLVVGKTEDLVAVEKSGSQETGRVILIKPMVEHYFVESPEPAWHIFLAAYSPLTASLDELAGDKNVAALPLSALPFHGSMSKSEITEALATAMAGRSFPIDPRLAAALDFVDKVGPKVSLVDISKQCDLSPSRLRVLAKEQLGISLAALLVWRKLVNAMKALSLGATVSEAAQAGGFADQSHFTRTMRKTFGITPHKSSKNFNYEK